MSFNSHEVDLASGQFHTTADDSVPRKSSDMQAPRINSPNGPLPLPEFVFPAKAPPLSPSPRSAPASFSRATTRRPLSAIELSGGRTEKTNGPESEDRRLQLPAWSFDNQLQSPPLSPLSTQISSRSHTRGGSEFIGGDGKTGNGMGLMSVSPTKGDNVLPAPSASAFGSSARRRGHAHRRSAAMSCHDISMILKPDPNISRGGSSAPTSPAGDNAHQHDPFPSSLDSTVQSGDKDASHSGESTPPVKAFNRNRVGFSDTVDIIPRPLSLVSSDSASTVRQGHSVTGSMSSVISAGTSSPSSKEKRGMPLPSSQRTADNRPKTAEPLTDRETTHTPHTPKRRNSIPLLLEAAAATTSVLSTPKSAKKWSFFTHESASGESSPKSRPTSAASSEKDPKPSPIKAMPSSPDPAEADTPIQSLEPSSSRRSSVSRKSNKKQKKVRSWAGSILSRKSRQRSQKQKLSRRSPTPPLRSYNPMDESTNFEFDQTQQSIPIRPELQTGFASWKPRKLPRQEESMSPIIDLDAALGPFNTPTSFGSDWNVSQRGGVRKRAMHSAAGLGGFSGPGMHYHRRAESAPEFENPRFGLHRLGSSSTMGMEDVFEEDEEDEDEEWEDAKASSDKESNGKAGEDDEDVGLGIDIKVVDSDGMQADKSMNFDEATFQRGIKRKGSGLSEGDRRQVSSTKSEHSSTSLIDEPIMEESSSPVEIVDDSIPARPDSGAKSSDSTATPPLRARPGKELVPVDVQSFSLQPPYPTSTSPRSTTQSSFPSPRSPFSYDAQRISTAPSSVTDEQGFQSLLLGEPGPEVRMSVDDVPSLTSSNSTMTRDSGIPPAAHNLQFREGQRSASVSSAAISRKRSSMASLSRLISSSHGERSKLSIESRPSTSEGERKEKTSRSKRISRMMQFWKPKESVS